MHVIMTFLSSSHFFDSAFSMMHMFAPRRRPLATARGAVTAARMVTMRSAPARANRARSGAQTIGLATRCVRVCECVAVNAVSECGV